MKKLEFPYRDIVQKIFEFGGHTFSDEIDFQDNKNPWYEKYTWTKEQEKAFFKWFRQELYDNSKMRRALCIRKNKKEINKAVYFFYLFTPKVEERV